MIRTLIGAAIPAFAIVGFAAFWLWVMPVHAASCAGQMVLASFYGAESGSRTASGLRFDGSQWLVAHRSLPFHTRLRLTYRGRSVVVPVEDRGPYIKGRALDLSRAVAKSLGTIPAGVVTLCMERLP